MNFFKNREPAYVLGRCMYTVRYIWFKFSPPPCWFTFNCLIKSFAEKQRSLIIDQSESIMWPDGFRTNFEVYLKKICRRECVIPQLFFERNSTTVSDYLKQRVIWRRWKLLKFLRKFICESHNVKYSYLFVSIFLQILSKWSEN